MKKVFFVVFVFLIPVFSYSSDLFFGGGVSLTSNKSGGYGEFGVSIYNNSSFEMRNIISIDGYGKNIFNGENTIGYFGITEKITFGLSTDYVNKNIFVIPYGFAAGGFSFVGAQGSPLFDAPYSYEVYAGLGADIFSFNNLSIFVEAGGGYESFTGTLPAYNHIGNGFARMNVGFRGFIKSKMHKSAKI